MVNKCPHKCEDCQDKDRCLKHQMMQMGLAGSFPLGGLGNLGALLFPSEGLASKIFTIDLEGLPDMNKDPKGFEIAIAKALEEKGFPPQWTQSISQQYTQEEASGSTSEEAEGLEKLKASILEELKQQKVPSKLEEKLAQKISRQAMGGLGGMPDGMILTTFLIGGTPSQMIRRRPANRRTLVKSAVADELLNEAEEICVDRALKLLIAVKEMLRADPIALGDLYAGKKAFNIYCGNLKMNAAICPIALAMATDLVNGESKDTEFYFTQKSSGGKEGDIKEVGIRLTEEKMCEVRRSFQ